jgi:hypothetical protein
MKAYRIVNWWRFELLKNGKLASAKTRMESLRKSPLIYVRFPVHGHTLTADYRRMVKRAGDWATACDGLYKMLVGLAGNQVREYRGWVLDDRQRPLDPGQVAELLCLSERKVSQIFEILLCDEVKWVEFSDFPKALHKSLNRSDLSADPNSGDGGKKKEKKGAPFIEAETVGFSKGKGFESEADRNQVGGVREKKGEGESQGGGENVQPQPQPAAQPSDSGSGTDSVPASDSEKPADSVSDSVPATDSVSQAGPRAGAGAGGSGFVSEKRRFEIIRECQKAALEFTQIINPRTNSDTTTISDIYAQLQQRLITGSPYPLFELSLNTARQCWRGNKPIAMFVAAMKKPPFYYVPRKLSVIPGKFSQGSNIK